VEDLAANEDRETLWRNARYVSKLAALTPEASYNNSKMRTVTRAGTTYVQNTANIGKAPASAPYDPAQSVLPHGRRAQPHYGGTNSASTMTASEKSQTSERAK
jgi:hypothetical protein